MAAMKTFWQEQLAEIDSTRSAAAPALPASHVWRAGTDFKRIKHQLPLARIKKIMKSDEDVRVSERFRFCSTFMLSSSTAHLLYRQFS